jgi:hypothetical protein
MENSRGFPPWYHSMSRRISQLEKNVVATPAKRLTPVRITSKLTGVKLKQCLHQFPSLFHLIFFKLSKWNWSSRHVTSHTNGHAPVSQRCRKTSFINGPPKLSCMSTIGLNIVLPSFSASIARLLDNPQGGVSRVGWRYLSVLRDLPKLWLHASWDIVPYFVLLLAVVIM